MTAIRPLTHSLYIRTKLQCSVLKDSALRTVGGARFTLDQLSVRAVTKEDAKGAMLALQRADGLHEDTDKIVFDELALDEVSEKSIEALRDVEEVVLMPGEEFVLAHGPKRTVLFWLCRDVGVTMKINGFLEGEPAFHQHALITPACIMIATVHSTVRSQGICAYLLFVDIPSTLAMMEVVPYELTWLMVLVLPDALRKLFKLNTEAAALVLRELDFWIPFVPMCLGGCLFSASFAHDGAAAAVAINLVVSVTVNVLLGKLTTLMLGRLKLHVY